MYTEDSPMSGTVALDNRPVDIEQIMQDTLNRQRIASNKEGLVSAETRIDRIDRSIDLLVRYKTELCNAVSEDFGHRSIHQSRMVDIGSSLTALRDAKKKLRRWMRSEKRRPMFPLGLLGAKAMVKYQPLGVVGCISPWNFPVQLTFSPLAGILSAGNRVMIKPSEYTPVTSELMKNIFAENFDSEEIALFTGDVDVGSAFSQLAFNHLLFTGSTATARNVMRSAANNLVPVTLELGGKSPVIIGKDCDLRDAAEKIMMGKTMNAGQICLAPDYVFIHSEKREQFVEMLKESVAKMFPEMVDNPDYTSVVNDRNYSRIQSYIEDALQKGAEVEVINPAHENFDKQKHHRIPPTLIIEPSDDMMVMQEEIFGPLLIIKKYSDINECINFINERARPLALYYFGKNKAEQNLIIDNTTSGGVTINDVMMHASQEDLPFGGVGESGIGSYHGFDGFRNFSNAKAIFTQSDLVSKLAAKMRPPYQ